MTSCSGIVLVFSAIVCVVFGNAPASVQYRFTVNLTSEHYTPALGNTSSIEFHLLAHELTDRFAAIFQDLEGNQNAVVEQLTQFGGGLLVHTHLTSQGQDNKEEIQNRIRIVLARGYLGRFKTNADGFELIPTTEPASIVVKWDCPAGSYWCRDGSCINMALLCNGKAECADKSDEDECEPKLVSVIVHPHSLTIPAGRRAQFFCGSAEMKNRMKWTRKDTDISKKHNVFQKTGRLQITNVSEADAGEYVCSAERALEGSSATVKLTVTPREETPVSGAETAEDPDVELSISIISAFEGTSAEISCDVVGGELNNNATIVWSKIEGELPASANVTASSHTLYIPSLSFQDAGFYECRPSDVDTSEGPQSVAQIIVVPDPKATLHLAFKRGNSTENATTTNSPAK